MATYIIVLIITSCILVKINVFSLCWCLHLSISREPIFTETDQHSSPGCVTLCTSRETHITLVVTVRHGKCQYVCSWISSGHIPKTSTSMFSICPMLERLFNSNYSSSQNILIAFCMCVETEKVNTLLKMAPIHLCKIGLVLNGVYQFLPVFHWEI